MHNDKRKEYMIRSMTDEESVFEVTCRACGFKKELMASNLDDAISRSDESHQNWDRGLISRCQGENYRLRANPIPKFSCD
jgi:hypothetical protein